MQGDLNANRKKYIQLAFNKLDVTRDGVIKLEDIAQIYDATKHPDVVQGKKTKDEIYIEFMSQWDT